MKRADREKAIYLAYHECGQKEYAARMGAAFAIDQAGKLFEQRTRMPRQDYQIAVANAERLRTDQEREARLVLFARLRQLGVIREE